MKVRNFLSSIPTPAKFAKKTSSDGRSSSSQSSSLTCEGAASLRCDSSTDESVDNEKRFLQSSFQETSRAPSPHFTDEISSVYPQETGNCLSLETPHYQIEPLYAGASLDYNTFDTMLRSFSFNFHLDDSATIELLKMFRLSLPKSAKIPFPHSSVYRMKKRFHDFSSVISLDTGSYCSLSFSEFLKHVVELNWCNLVKYAERRTSCHVPDIPLDKVCSNFSPETITLHLCLSTDGVSIVKSSSKNELWPLWLSLCELPPKIRMMQRNIILAGLYSGETKPPWEAIVSELQKNLASLVEIMSSDGSKKVQFRVLMIVADSIARPHILNMYQHNGFYGCTYCTALGVTFERHHGYYPHDLEFEIRNSELTDRLVTIAETEKLTGGAQNVCGVKGRSSFAELVDGLPLACGIDYMHCVLLGVYHDLLKQHLKTLTAFDRCSFINKARATCSPKELAAHGRRIRGVDEIGYFKANEFYNYLFFVAVVLLREKLDRKLYEHYLFLVFGIRTLLESDQPRAVAEAEQMLQLFCEQYADLYCNEKLETFNVHLLKHLSHQVSLQFHWFSKMLGHKFYFPIITKT